MAKGMFRPVYSVLGLSVVVLLVLGSIAVFGVPTGPDTFTVDGSSGFTGGLNGTLIEAEA
ncbi:hypothetical protein HY640_03305, partial [Candidatus Woesearchaeota archaeon]|nr:hypothetical protein [Candidatus Woesearchaeota archaeon]